MKKQVMDAVAGALGAKPSKNLKVHEVSIRRGHKGGYIAKHSLKDEEGMHHDSHEYPIMSKADLHKHLDEHMPEEAAEGAAEKVGSGGEGYE